MAGTLLAQAGPVNEEIGIPTPVFLYFSVNGARAPG